MPLCAILVVCSLTSCAVFRQSEDRGIEYRLKQAGFRVATASPTELSHLAPYKLEGRMREGKVIYRYANPARGRVYEGGRKEYERYRQIARATQERRVTNLNQIGPRRPTGPLLW
jgi:hypothetical protein